MKIVAKSVLFKSLKYWNGGREWVPSGNFRQKICFGDELATEGRKFGDTRKHLNKANQIICVTRWKIKKKYEKSEAWEMREGEKIVWE